MAAKKGLFDVVELMVIIQINKASAHKRVHSNKRALKKLTLIKACTHKCVHSIKCQFSVFFHSVSFCRTKLGFFFTGSIATLDRLVTREEVHWAFLGY